MKKFISIPNNFKGVGEATENLIFPAIIDRHAEAFITCYRKADLLFKRLDKVQEQFKVCKIPRVGVDVFLLLPESESLSLVCCVLQDWVVLGALDLEEFVDKHLESLSDWERNFKALKARGRDAEKLPMEIKVSNLDEFVQ